MEATVTAAIEWLDTNGSPSFLLSLFHPPFHSGRFSFPLSRPLHHALVTFGRFQLIYYSNEHVNHLTNCTFKRFLTFKKSMKSD
jgi:hypothetical protein